MSEKKLPKTYKSGSPGWQRKQIQMTLTECKKDMRLEKAEFGSSTARRRDLQRNHLLGVRNTGQHFSKNSPKSMRLMEQW